MEEYIDLAEALYFAGYTVKQAVSIMLDIKKWRENNE